MMQHLAIRSGTSPHEVEAAALRVGSDVVVCFGGGDTPHIASVALGTPRPAGARPEAVGATASVLCVSGHDEDELARRCAVRLATKLNAQVCVTVGFHLTGAKPGDRRRLVTNYEAALDGVERELTEGG